MKKKVFGLKRMKGENAIEIEIVIVIVIAISISTKTFFFSSRRRKHNQLTILYGDVNRSIDLRMYIILYCRLFN